jgi:hypothetical protein
MKKSNVIGLSGVAGSGKDLFCDLCMITKNTSLWPLKSFSIAGKLKEECFDFIYNKYGININTCSWEEKNAVRKILVAHGEIKRSQSRGSYWFDKLTQDITEAKEKYKTIIVTDVRFAEYEYDEVQWIRDSLDGYLVHISKFSIDENVGLMEVHQPANSSERENDPKVASLSDYQIEWENLSYIKDDREKENKLSKAIDKFSEWLQYRAHANKLAGRKSKKTYVWPK